MLSVFEGVVYHCWTADPSQPCRPVLEVEAVLREGDADATSGPLLLSVADYVVMAGGMADGHAVAAAQALGCDLAYMGTKFIATRESMMAIL